MTKYSELFRKLKTMFKRIAQSVGEENFHEEVTKKYPMPLDDQSVVAVAIPLGWKQEWLKSPHAKAKAKASAADSTRDIAEMLAKAGPMPSQVAAAPPTLPLQAPSVRSPAVLPAVPPVGSASASGVSWQKIVRIIRSLPTFN